MRVVPPAPMAAATLGPLHAPALGGCVALFGAAVAVFGQWLAGTPVAAIGRPGAVWGYDKIRGPGPDADEVEGEKPGKGCPIGPAAVESSEHRGFEARSHARPFWQATPNPEWVV